MNKIDVSELLDLTAYEKAREAMRADVIELKKSRRVSVGDRITLLFENRATVLFQIQEMVRTERIVEETKIEDEVRTYNALIPDEGELSATLFIEIPGIARMSHDEQIAAVNRFQGLDRDAVFLVLGDHRFAGRFEEGRTKEEKMSAVHFLRFRLSTEAVRSLRDPARPALLVVAHPNYEARQELGSSVRAELLRDLD
jgi:TusA-related sulfurtransferase